MADLEDKVAVVTGAGRGIGRDIALAFARAGADLVLASRTEQTLHQTRALIEQLGKEGLVVPTDISQPSDVRELADRTLDHFGRVDVLVNNSGIGGVSAPHWEIDPTDWQATFDVNVTGTLPVLPSVPSLDDRSAVRIRDRHRLHDG